MIKFMNYKILITNRVFADYQYDRIFEEHVAKCNVPMELIFFEVDQSIHEK